MTTTHTNNIYSTPPRTTSTSSSSLRSKLAAAGDLKTSRIIRTSRAIGHKMNLQRCMLPHPTLSKSVRRNLMTSYTAVKNINVTDGPPTVATDAPAPRMIGRHPDPLDGFECQWTGSIVQPLAIPPNSVATSNAMDRRLKELASRSVEPSNTVVDLTPDTRLRYARRLYESKQALVKTYGAQLESERSSIHIHQLSAAQDLQRAEAELECADRLISKLQPLVDKSEIARQTFAKLLLHAKKLKNTVREAKTAVEAADRHWKEWEKHSTQLAGITAESIEREVLALVFDAPRSLWTD